MEKKKNREENSSLKQNCRPRRNLSHHLSTRFPLTKNLYQDHELVKSDLNAPVVCRIKVKIWRSFIGKRSYLRTRFPPFRAKADGRFLTGPSRGATSPGSRRALQTEGDRAEHPRHRHRLQPADGPRSGAASTRFCPFSRKVSYRNKNTLIFMSILKRR